jgi:hypothetical protein
VNGSSKLNYLSSQLFVGTVGGFISNQSLATFLVGFNFVA